jgi:hypothetical protein
MKSDWSQAALTLKTKLRSSFWPWIPMLAITLSTGGCVIIPVPLVGKQTEIVWGVKDKNGNELSIEERTKTVYYQSYWLAWGSVTLPNEKSRYDYFLVNKKDGKATELSFLKIKCEGLENWHAFESIDGTPYWMAMREVDSTNDCKTITARGEIVVFDNKSIQHTRLLTFVDLPDTLWSEKLWANLNYSQTEKFIIYNSKDGYHRYKILDDVDGRIDSKTR